MDEDTPAAPNITSRLPIPNVPPSTSGTYREDLKNLTGLDIPTPIIEGCADTLLACLFTREEILGKAFLLAAKCLQRQLQITVARGQEGHTATIWDIAGQMRSGAQCALSQKLSQLQEAYSPYKMPTWSEPGPPQPVKLSDGARVALWSDSRNAVPISVMVPGFDTPRVLLPGKSLAVAGSITFKSDARCSIKWTRTGGDPPRDGTLTDCIPWPRAKVVAPPPEPVAAKRKWYQFGGGK